LSEKLARQIEVELTQIEQLLAVYRHLIAKCREKQPDLIELSALGAMLHAYYTGIENIFKRVLVETGGTMPKGEYWHTEF
jgi:hypothetical protein